jgi:hypothetical protein
MKGKHVLISAGVLLFTLLLKDYISEKINKKKKPTVIVYKTWRQKHE